MARSGGYLEVEGAGRGLIHQPDQLAVVRLHELDGQPIGRVGSVQDGSKGGGLVGAADEESDLTRAIEDHRSERDAGRGSPRSLDAYDPAVSLATRVAAGEERRGMAVGA